jgi:hypothetical protein
MLAHRAAADFLHEEAEKEVEVPLSQLQLPNFTEFFT